MGKNKVQCGLKHMSAGIGAGIIAGLAGTVAITISQMIEMKITKRQETTGAADAVEKTLDIHPGPGTKEKMSDSIHWVYGTLWGLARGVLGITGMNKWLATGIHCVAISSSSMAVAPLEGQKPVDEWEPKDIAIDVLHHVVYSVAAGCVFDFIMKGHRD